MLARFIKRFPEIQSIIDGDHQVHPVLRPAAVTDDSLIVSQKSYDRKMDDLDELNKVKIPRESQAIEAARELGDLREKLNIKWRKMNKTFEATG